MDNFENSDCVPIFIVFHMFVTGNEVTSFDWSNNTFAKISANSNTETLQKPLQCLSLDNFHVSIKIIPNIVV